MRLALKITDDINKTAEKMYNIKHKIHEALGRLKKMKTRRWWKEKFLELIEKKKILHFR